MTRHRPAAPNSSSALHIVKEDEHVIRPRQPVVERREIDAGVQALASKSPTSHAPGGMMEDTIEGTRRSWCPSPRSDSITP